MVSTARTASRRVVKPHEINIVAVRIVWRRHGRIIDIDKIQRRAFDDLMQRFGRLTRIDEADRERRRIVDGWSRYGKRLRSDPVGCPAARHDLHVDIIDADANDPWIGAVRKCRVSRLAGNRTAGPRTAAFDFERMGLIDTAV